MKSKIGVYLLIFFLKSCSFLPIGILFFLGNKLGLLLYHVASKRRKVAIENCTRAYPDKDYTFYRKIVKQSFASLGVALFEYAIVWFWSKEKLKNLLEIKNAKYYEQALQKKQGALILLAHFTTVEIIGILLSSQVEISAVFFSPKNPTIKNFLQKKRQKHLNVINYKSLKSMIRTLKQNKIVLYSSDQSKYERGAPYIKFFNTKVKTTTGTIKIARLARTQIIPAVHFRDEKNKKYVIEFLPPIKNIPTDDIKKDTLTINQTLEEIIKKYPEQYMWLHKRFKETK
jgi:Kdo2-lipid IVA lauroyltransferase/acyltransferase